MCCLHLQPAHLDSHFQCFCCPMGFSDPGAVDRHMKKCHNASLYEQSMAQLTGMPVFNNGKLLLPPKGSNMSSFGFGSTTPLTGGRQSKPFQHKGKSGSTTLQSLQDKLKQKRETTLGGRLYQKKDCVFS